MLLALKKRGNPGDWKVCRRIKHQDSRNLYHAGDALGNATRFHLTARKAHDLEGEDALMSQTLAVADCVLADKA